MYYYFYYQFIVSLLELTELCPDASSGCVSAQSVGSAIKDNTVLISVMLANNETGIIQVCLDYM